MNGNNDSIQSMMLHATWCNRFDNLIKLKFRPQAINIGSFLIKYLTLTWLVSRKLAYPLMVSKPTNATKKTFQQKPISKLSDLTFPPFPNKTHISESHQIPPAPLSHPDFTHPRKKETEKRLFDGQVWIFVFVSSILVQFLKLNSIQTNKLPNEFTPSTTIHHITNHH